MGRGRAKLCDATTNLLLHAASANDGRGAARACWRTGPNIFAMNPAARIPGMRLLHSPGPTRVPDEVVNAMARQPTDLADPRLQVLIAACESGMKALLGSERAEVFFYA